MPGSANRSDGARSDNNKLDPQLDTELCGMAWDSAVRDGTAISNSRYGM